MAFAHSPKIVTDGMVFYYDTGNSKSYAGEPTENLISPEGLTFTQITTYTDMLHSQVVDSSSPSGYACEMEIGALPVNNSARARFGFAANIPTSGTAYVTVYAKFEGGTVADIRPAIYSGASWQIMVPLDGGSIYLTDEYRRFGVLATLGTGSGGPNPGFSMTYSNSGGAIGQKTRWHSPQVEVKSHATPFINGTRSATEALKDFTKNATLDLSNVSFDSNAQMEFDGTDDYISLGTPSALTSIGASNFTISCWAKADALSTGWTGLVYLGRFGESNGHLGFNPSNNVSGGTGDGSTWQTHQTTYTLTVGTWYNLVMTRSGNFITFYANGQQIDTPFAHPHTPATASAYLEVGNGSANEYFNGKIYNAQIFNRALSSEEVQQNFNTIKGRFGI